jgi:hypothetical protein
MSGWDDLGLSEDVDAILGAGDRRKENRRLSPAQQRERARQAARVRVRYDVPGWLKDEVERIAAREEVSASSMGAFLLARGLRAYRAGDCRPRKVACESPRFEFLVDVDERDAGF